jgi:internalin A
MTVPSSGRVEESSNIQAAAEAEQRIKEAIREGHTELDLSEMNLTEVPRSVFRISKLWALDLKDNRLTTLPNAIGQLTQLRRLDLGSNQLENLPR